MTANWDNVFQSIREIWIPAGGVVVVIAIVAIVFSRLKRKGN